MNLRPDRHPARRNQQHHPHRDDDQSIRLKIGGLGLGKLFGIRLGLGLWLHRRSRVWICGVMSLLVCLAIGLNRGSSAAAPLPTLSLSQNHPDVIGVAAQSKPSFTSLKIVNTAIETTSRDHPLEEPSVTQLRLRGQNRRALAMVLRSLGVPEALTRTLQRDDFPVLTLMALGLDQTGDLDQFDRETFSDRLVTASEAGVSVSNDQRQQLQDLADIFQAIGERDLVEPLLLYTLNASDRDLDRAALYERLGRFHTAQAQWHEKYQADFTVDEYQAALAAYKEAAELVQADREATLRLQLASLRTDLAARRYQGQQLPDEQNESNESDYAEFAATLNLLAQRFHAVYRDVINADETPNTITTQLDLASQLACLQSLATPTSQTFAVSPTVRYCAAPDWTQPLPMIAQILDDRRDLLDRATRASADLSERQPPASLEASLEAGLAATIAQRLQVQALLLSGDVITAPDLMPAIAAQMIPQVKQGLDLVESLGAKDLSVQLLWQAGRLAIAAEQPIMAREYYAQAIADLAQLRIDLGSLETDWRYDFRDAIAPLYQDYLALLLPPPDATLAANYNPDSSLAVPTNRDDLIKAIATLQGLQLAELDDFFGEACAIPQEFEIAELDKPKFRGKYRYTALLATVVLPDRTETIIGFPDDQNPELNSSPGGDQSETVQRQWLRYSNPSGQSKVESELPQLLEALKSPSGYRLRKRTQEVYSRYFQAAIAAMEQASNSGSIDTILFLPDSGFRSIPLGALHAEEGDYLLEHYDIAVIPSFDLISTDPEPRSRPRLRTLAAGRSKFEGDAAITRSITSFGRIQGSPNSGKLTMTNLDFVESEIRGIVDLLPQSLYLLDEDFLSETFAETIASRRYDVAHIATHGSFGALAAETFIVADELIPFDRLGQILRSNDPTRATDLDLVIFSACQTAEGSDRAVLGMAGMGLRAGVRSTIGSLWNVSDQSTSLIMQAFYRYRRDGLSKAAALAAAQRDAIAGQLDVNTEDATTQSSFKSPYYWSPFVLVGEW
jgi:CHAT domain-containing protein